MSTCHGQGSLKPQSRGSEKLSHKGRPSGVPNEDWSSSFSHNPMIVMGVEGPPNGVVGCQREEEEKLGLVSVDSSAASLLSYQAPPVLFPTSSTLELGSTSPQRSVLLQASLQRPLPLIVPHSWSCTQITSVLSWIHPSETRIASEAQNTFSSLRDWIGLVFPPSQNALKIICNTNQIWCGEDLKS